MKLMQKKNDTFHSNFHRITNWSRECVWELQMVTLWQGAEYWIELNESIERAAFGVVDSVQHLKISLQCFDINRYWTGLNHLHCWFFVPEFLTSRRENVSDRIAISGIFLTLLSGKFQISRKFSRRCRRFKSERTGRNRQCPNCSV